MIKILREGITVAIANARTLLMQYRFSQISVCVANILANIPVDVAKTNIHLRACCNTPYTPHCETIALLVRKYATSDQSKYPYIIQELEKQKLTLFCEKSLKSFQKDEISRVYVGFLYELQCIN